MLAAADVTALIGFQPAPGSGTATLRTAPLSMPVDTLTGRIGMSVRIGRGAHVVVAALPKDGGAVCATGEARWPDSGTGADAGAGGAGADDSDPRAVQLGLSARAAGGDGIVSRDVVWSTSSRAIAIGATACGDGAVTFVFTVSAGPLYSFALDARE